MSRAFRIEDLSHLSGTTVRTIRAYTDRGLLPKPGRHGRANVYDDTHLTRLRQIADLLERGYTLASIKELLEAWDAGTGLGDVLGLVGAVDQPWSDEEPARIHRADLWAAFGGHLDPGTVQEALDLGVLEAVQGDPDTFLVPSPRELAVAAELHRVGVPLPAITGHLREVRGQIEHISERLLEFTTEYVFQPFLTHAPNEEGATEAIDLIRRLRPLAQQTLDAELARAMRIRATELMRRHLGEGALLPPPHPTTPSPPSGPPPAFVHMPGGLPLGGDGGAEPPWGGAGLVWDGAALSPRSPEPSSGDCSAPESLAVLLPAPTVAAVRALVGADNVSAFVAAAADREVAARRMNAMSSGVAAEGARPGEEGPAGA